MVDEFMDIGGDFEIDDEEDIDELEQIEKSLSVFQPIYDSIDDIIIYAKSQFSALKDVVSKRYIQKKDERLKIIEDLEKLLKKSQRIGDETMNYLVNMIFKDIQKYFEMEDLTTAFFTQYGAILKEIIKGAKQIKNEVRKIELKYEKKDLKVVDITELNKLINEIVANNPNLKELSVKISDLLDRVETLENFVKLKLE